MSGKGPDTKNITVVYYFKAFLQTSSIAALL